MTSKRIHLIHGLQYGGSEQMLTGLLVNQPNTNDIVISLTSLGVFGEKLEEKGIAVYPLNIDKNPLNIASIYKILKRNSPQTIISWGYYTDLLAFIFGHCFTKAKIVWNVRRSILRNETEPWYRKLVRFSLAKLSSRIDLIIFNSQLGYKTHQNYGYNVDASKIIQNGINTKRFNRNSTLGTCIREKLKIKDDELLIGYVARYDLVKGHSLLIQAIKKLHSKKNIHFCFVGKNTKLLYPVIADAGLNQHVSLEEPISNIEEYYNAFDIHIMTSYSEGFPNVIAEAMACETPCISTSAGEAGKIIGDTGIIIENQSSDDIARAIESFLGKEKKELRELGKKARQRIVEHYNIDRCIKNFITAFETID